MDYEEYTIRLTESEWQSPTELVMAPKGFLKKEEINGMIHKFKLIIYYVAWTYYVTSF